MLLWDETALLKLQLGSLGMRFMAAWVQSSEWGVLHMSDWDHQVYGYYFPDKQDPGQDESSLSGAAIAGVVTGVLAMICLCGLATCCCVMKKRVAKIQQSQSGEVLQ
eukprot:EST45843.1 Hypothetical protein SS50377_14185 [Spironucleus salmonicida]